MTRKRSLTPQMGWQRAPAGEGEGSGVEVTRVEARTDTSRADGQAMPRVQASGERRSCCWNCCAPRAAAASSVFTHPGACRGHQEASPPTHHVRRRLAPALARARTSLITARRENRRMRYVCGASIVRRRRWRPSCPCHHHLYRSVAWNITSCPSPSRASSISLDPLMATADSPSDPPKRRTQCSR